MGTMAREVTRRARAGQSSVAPLARAADTCIMRNQAADSLRDFGRKAEAKFKEEMPRVEEEVQKVITYLNDVVVPEVRDNSSRALRAASEQLAKLAERLDRKAGFGPRGR